MDLCGFVFLPRLHLFSVSGGRDYYEELLGEVWTSRVGLDNVNERTIY